MKFLFLFFAGLFFGFFDFFYLLFFFVFSLVFLILDYNYFWFGGFFFCDGLSFFLMFLTILIFFFCFFSSMIDNWNKNFFESFSFILSSIFFFLLFCFVSFSVFSFYIYFEFIFMLMFIFLLSWGYSPERLQASFYMVFYTIVVSFPFLVFVIFVDLNVFSFKFLFFYSSDLFSYSWFLVFLVFLVKLPVYGVHLWLPKAHVEAPVSGSMLLAGVLLKLGGYGFLRFTSFFSFSFMKYSGFFLSIGLVGGLVSCFICLHQSDLKAFVAYSSVCHMGFGLGGLYSISFFGYSGMVYMLIAHGFCSSCLFYILYVFYERYHSRSLMILKGIGLLFPMMMLVWFVFSVLNMGVPPSFSFFSEISIIAGILGSSIYGLFFVGLFLFFAGVYGIFLYVVSCHGISLLESISLNFSVREFLNMYGHFFPLLFVPIFMSLFFFKL